MRSSYLGKRKESKDQQIAPRPNTDEMGGFRDSGSWREARPKLVAQLLPQLAKPNAVIGEFIEIQGRDWAGCPTSEKDKWFKCVVRKFDAVRDFPGGIKAAGFQVQEMGESGEGSLEPGVASGDVFWVVYPNPFLKHYYKANPEKLPDGHRDKPVVAAAAPAAAADSPMVEAATPATPANGALPALKQDALVYSFFCLESDELCGKPGPNHGNRPRRTSGSDTCAGLPRMASSLRTRLASRSKRSRKALQ
jgi:hypothetical protein